MEYLFAAIALPCLGYALADYLGYFLKNWKDAEQETEWKPRKDASDYENL